MSCGGPEPIPTVIEVPPKKPTPDTAGGKLAIGKQVWMVQNLNVDKFRNGDPIPEAKTNEEWIKAAKTKQPAWCYYDNRSVQPDTVNGHKYGKLYNFYAVADARGLCPAGWHVPSDDEWTILTNNLGGEKIAGKKMKSEQGWEHDKGNNESSFLGLPGGMRTHDGKFINYQFSGYWWSSSENTPDYPEIRSLNYHQDELVRDNLQPSKEPRTSGGFELPDYEKPITYNPNSSKPMGFSVRCVNDLTVSEIEKRAEKENK